VVNQDKTNIVSIQDVPHVTLVNQHSTTFNQRLTSVSKSRLWSTQVHNHCPIIV